MFEVPVDLRSLPVAIATWKFYAIGVVEAGSIVLAFDPGLAYPTGL